MVKDDGKTRFVLLLTCFLKISFSEKICVEELDFSTSNSLDLSIHTPPVFTKEQLDEFLAIKSDIES